MSIPKFAAPPVSVHAELKRRVNQYFQQHNIAPTGNGKLYQKAAILLVGYLATYIHLIFFTPSLWIAIPECIILGLFTAAIGFNVMHDGAHGSFSKIPWINNIAAFTLDFLGASSFMWNVKHNIVHHAYTNVAGVDDDIDAGIFLRLCEDQKRLKMHKYQHLYFWMPYALLYLYWIYYADYYKYFKRKIGVMPLKKMKTKDHVAFWGFKALHAVMYIVLPIYFWGVVPWALGYLLYASFAGVVLSIVFQLAHTVEETSFPKAIQPANKLEDEWAVHQLRTTANFAPRNKFVTWFVGGLNFQVEHHLFPKISHIHYPKISNIVRETCKELGVPYLEHPKMRLAVASHIHHLKRMGEVD